MIDQSQLTEEEIITLKTIILTKQKEQLEKEIAEMKGKNTPSNQQLADYFKD